MWQIIVLKDLISVGFGQRCFLGKEERGGWVGLVIPSHLNLFFSHSIETVNFLGEASLLFLHSHSVKPTIFQPFSIITLIFAFCLLFSWNLNLLYVIYHLIVMQFMRTFWMQNMKILAWLLDEHLYHQKIVQSYFNKNLQYYV